MKFLLLTFLACTLCYGQRPQIGGRVRSKSDNSALPGANVILLKADDSSLVKGMLSDAEGRFAFRDVPQGRYVLKVLFIGYDPYFKDLTLSDEPLRVNVRMEESPVAMKGAEVVGKIEPSIQKGDTTQYQANAFKTNPDATGEDLVGKMPGITTQNGTVQAQGEDVKQVLVDGKPFFGEDPNAALRNLPAEVIDKIEIFDKKSEQAQFTGFDDGSSVKTMNIITKPRFRNGIFGKFYAGHDDEDRYRSGGNLNIFHNDRRMSFLAQSNNVNEQNFSTEDLLGVIGSSNRGGGGGFGGRRGAGGGGRIGGGGGFSAGQPGNFGGNNASNFLVNQTGGIATTNSFGINYVDKWSDRVDVSMSYFFNWNRNRENDSLFRQYVLPSDSGLDYNQAASSPSRNINHRLNMRIDYKIDSLNSVLFQPRLSVQDNNGSNDLSGTTEALTQPINATQSDFSSKLTGITTSLPVLYRHRFEKRGRTVSLSVTPGYNQNTGTSGLQATDIFYALSSDTLNQNSNLDKKGYTLASNAAYTEPFGLNSLLQFNLGTNYIKNESDKRTFDFSPLTRAYDHQDTSLSNTFNSHYVARQTGLTYRFQDPVCQAAFGVEYQWAELKGDEEFPYAYRLDRKFRSVLPNAMFQFKFSPKQNLRIFYRTSNNAPTIDQLQDAVNNSNPTQLTTGNPNLKQDFQHNLIARYSSSGRTTFFALFALTTTNDYIGKSTIIAARDTVVGNNITLLKGTQLTRSANLNGYYNARAFMTYAVPVSPIRSNLNLNLSGNYSRTPSLINGQLNEADAPSFGLGAVLSSNVSENLDFTVSSNSTLNYVHNTLQDELNTHYFSQNSQFKFNWIFLGGVVLSSNVSHQYYSGLTQSYNQNYVLWNAGVGYKFLQEKQAEIRLSVFDILNENHSVQRNTADTYIEDQQTNVLKRYVMLTFTYNLKNSRRG